MLQNQWTESETYVVACRAHDFATQGHFEEAAVLFEGVLAVAPSGSAAHGYARRALAAVLAQIGNPAAALAVLDAGMAAHGVAERKLRLDVLLALDWQSEAALELSRLSNSLEPVERNRYTFLIQSKQLNSTAADKSGVNG